MRTFLPDTFAARQKGDVISQKELESLVGCGPGDARYSLRIHRIAEMLMTFKRSVGDPCTVAQVKGDLRILTDREASKYNADLNDQGVRRIRSSNRRLGEVKVAGLSASDRERHDRRLVVSGVRTALVAGAMVNRVAKLTAHQRLVPSAATYRGGKKI